MRIADAIVAGLRGQTATFEVLLDRAQAIQQAILEANPGDVVVIAGKGHEPYQLVGDQVLSFDDRECARLALALRRGQRV
jgi:UDP-N-acetylmuramoyl-L-alanyl-D-glutamate--2,6-diaminopimelate ligase